MNPLTVDLVDVALKIDELSYPDLGDNDALAYRGSATCDMWQNWVPEGLAILWPRIPHYARICVYIMAKQRSKEAHS